MRSLSLSLATMLLSVAVSAQDAPPLTPNQYVRQHEGRFAEARHYILTPAAPLSLDQRLTLAEEGIAIVRPLTSGRFLVRVSNDADLHALTPATGTLEPLRAELKLASSAVREATSGRTFARVNIVFNDEVSLDNARAAIAAAGGELIDPFATRFSLPHSLRARVPAASIHQLAADERVLAVHGPAPRIANDNQVAAQTARVDLIQAAPYNLDGKDVVLSYFELSPADATHPEFGGRLTTHFPAGASSSDATHSTHTAGTMIASGINPLAKGMAPAATLHGFGVDDAGTWLDKKDQDIQTLGSVADNNSWGFILGWCDTRCDGPTGWVWTENDDYIGGYDTTDAALDQIARTGITLMVQSAGNEGTNNGPPSAPYAHNHVDKNGDTLKNETFCYSVDGSGNDCPAPTCTAGPAHCEVTRHPVHGSVGSIGLTAGAKNVVAVGATDSGRNVVGFSSRGPTRDGRVKPDITAKGFNTFSTEPNGGYGKLSGTSMAAPVVTGTAALLTQQWRKLFNNQNPSQSELKAVMIAGAVDIGNPGPDYTNGFGALDAKNSVDLILADGAAGKRIVSNSVAQGGNVSLPLTLSSAGDLRVVLVWPDPEVIFLPGASDLAQKALVNDIDLYVEDSKGTKTLPYVLDKNNPSAAATRGVNTVDNVEEVEIAGAAAGTYRVVVNGKQVNADGPQPFVVVSTQGSFGAACNDMTEPNDTAAQAFALGSGQKVTGRLCTNGDTDFFKFHVEKAGTLSLSLAATDTALTAVLTGPGVSSTTNVAAGATTPITQAVTAGDYVLQISQNGVLGAGGSYTLTATYPAATSSRTRTARH